MAVTIDAFATTGGGANNRVFNTSVVANGTNTLGTVLNVGATATAMGAFMIGQGNPGGTLGPISLRWDAAGANQTMTPLGTVLYVSAINTFMQAWGLVSPSPGNNALAIDNGPGNTAGGLSVSFVPVSFNGSEVSSVAAAFKGFNSASGTGTSGAVNTSASLPVGSIAIVDYVTDATVGSFPTDTGTLIDDEFGQLFWEQFAAASGIVNSSFSFTGSGDWGAMISGIVPPGGGGGSSVTYALQGQTRVNMMARRREEKKIWVPGRKIVRPRKSLVVS